MEYGLEQQDVHEIIGIPKKYPAVKAILFGSRAKGTFKPSSGIDIAVVGAVITHETVAAISCLLNEESATPYYFDVVHLEAATEKELIEHVNRVGQCQCLYSRESNAFACN